MKSMKIALAGLAVGFALAGLAGATSTATQTLSMQVGTICVVSVTGNPSTLTVAAPGTGGQTPASGTNNSTYVQYTSTVSAGLARKITAAWGGSDAAPAGCLLRLTATPNIATNQGSTAGQITVSATAQDLVTTIKSCATGTGGTSGAQLAYSLDVSDPTALVAGATKTATVTLTLTDAA
jgi:hypothetical protein